MRPPLVGGRGPDIVDPNERKDGCNALALPPGRVLVAGRGGDVPLEMAGAAFAEVDVHDVAVEGRDGGDEAAAVGVDDLGRLAVAELVNGDAVARRAAAAHGPRGSAVAAAGRRSMLLGARVRWSWRSVSSAIGQTFCWRPVRMTLISVC